MAPQVSNQQYNQNSSFYQVFPASEFAQHFFLLPDLELWYLSFVILESPSHPVFKFSIIDGNNSMC